MSTFDTIHESYINGQHAQFSEQVKEFGFVAFVEELSARSHEEMIPERVALDMILILSRKLELK